MGSRKADGIEIGCGCLFMALVVSAFVGCVTFASAVGLGLAVQFVTFVCAGAWHIITLAWGG